MDGKSDMQEYRAQDPPTTSHALANESAALHDNAKDHLNVLPNDEKPEVSDLTWEDDQAAFQPQLMHMPHEDFWILVRRFNYLVFRVRAIYDRPLSDLDMDTAEHENISPEKLQAQLARLYMSVMIPLFACWKHLVRLRSWNERRRTSAFLLVYAVAWAIDMVVPALFVLLAVLVVFPPSRPVLFPPAPPSIISAATGGVQTPPAGVLASNASVTAAPENHKGEAVELEAHSFITSFGKLITRITSEGTGDQGSPEDDPAPGLANVADKFASAKSKTDDEGQTDEKHDQTSKPMRSVIEDVPIYRLLDLLFDFIDTWERFANACSPTALFEARGPRLYLCACLLLPAIITLCLSRDSMMRGLQFCIGVVFFGRPLIHWSRNFLDRECPNWRIRCQLRNSILKGVPTNAQLTITMLRVGERNNSPLLPSPVSDTAPKPKATVTAESLNHIGATEDEIRQAIEPNSDVGKPETAIEPTSKPLLERFMRYIKRSSKRGVDVFHKVDKIKANHGNLHAQERLDIGQTTGQTSAPAGPLKFPARYNGTAGYIFFTTTANTPCVGWSSHKHAAEMSWSIQIQDINDISKVDGMSLKKGQIVRWALDKEAVDGLILTTTGGDRFHITEVVKRDAVFNRLIATGNQIWEVC